MKSVDVVGVARGVVDLEGERGTVVSWWVGGCGRWGGCIYLWPSILGRLGCSNAEV